jgi:hypothetical protein
VTAVVCASLHPVLPLQEAEKQQLALKAIDEVKEALTALCSYLVPGEIYQNARFEKFPQLIEELIQELKTAMREMRF